MDKVFQESAVRCGVNTAIIEKDFWVCWVLKQLFTDNALQKLEDEINGRE